MSPTSSQDNWTYFFDFSLLTITPGTYPITVSGADLAGNPYSPAGGLLILLPLIYDLSSFDFNIIVKSLTPYLTILVALLLVSKIPTLSLKKISISSKTTVFLLLTIGIIFIALLFYTFETLLIFSLIYLITIPVSIFLYKKQQKRNSTKISDEDHEDIL